MKVWSRCVVEVRCGDELECTDDECDVRLEAGRLTVSYFDDEGPVVYVGNEAAGGYELVCRSRPRRAMLQRSGDTLCGTWRERDETGSWTITLRE